MTSIFIPASVKSVKYGAFIGCENFSDVNYGGSETQWKAISFSEAEPGIANNPTIHWNSIGIGMSNNKNSASDKNIYFFSRWDDSTKQAVFANDNDRPYRFVESAKMIGAESIEALLNHFVLVETDASDPFLITSIELLKTKVDKVPDAANGIGMIAFESDPGRIWIADPNIKKQELFRGKTVLYHKDSHEKIVAMEPLQEMHGKIESCDGTSATIDGKVYPVSDFADTASILSEYVNHMEESVTFYIGSITGVTTLYKIDKYYSFNHYRQLKKHCQNR